VKKSSKNADRSTAGEGADLTLKERRLCLAFVGEANGSGVDAARIAGYKGTDGSLRVTAHRVLTKANKFVEQLRTDAERAARGKILSATQVLVGLTRIAEADVADAFPDDEWLQALKKQGVSRLIKSIQRDKDTGNITKIEMHNAHGAHVDLGKYHKLFTDRVEIVKPAEAAREAFQSILSETGISEEKAREIVAARFGISEQELISTEVM
jgi:hypothetical protein